MITMNTCTTMNAANAHMPEEVQAARALLAAEQLAVPGKPGQHRRGHRGPGGDLQRREQEDHHEVGQLLRRLERLAGNLGRELEAQVGADGLDRVRDQRPVLGDQVVPVAGGEDQAHVDRAGQDPELDRHEVPVPAQAEILPARQRDDR